VLPALDHFLRCSVCLLYWYKSTNTDAKYPSYYFQIPGLNRDAGAGALPRDLQHTSAYVSIRQHTSAYVSIRQHTSAYVRMDCQHTSAYVSRDAGAGALARETLGAQFTCFTPTKVQILTQNACSLDSRGLCSTPTLPPNTCFTDADTKVQILTLSETQGSTAPRGHCRRISQSCRGGGGGHALGGGEVKRCSGAKVCQHTSAYVSIHAAAAAAAPKVIPAKSAYFDPWKAAAAFQFGQLYYRYDSIFLNLFWGEVKRSSGLRSVRISQHTSAYVSIRQHTSAYMRSGEVKRSSVWQEKR
jgi:hypothetical protein